MKGHWIWSFNLLHHLFALASLKRICVHVLQTCCTHKLKSSIVVVACIDKVDWKLVQFSNGSTVAQLVRNILSRNLIKTWWDKIVNIYAFPKEGNIPICEEKHSVKKLDQDLVGQNCQYICLSKGRQYPYLWRESQCVESEIHTLQTQSQKEVNYTSEWAQLPLNVLPGPLVDSPPNSHFWLQVVGSETFIPIATFQKNQRILTTHAPPKLWFKSST
jgi:hypothetical protein